MNWKSFAFGVLCLVTLGLAVLVFRDAMALRATGGLTFPQPAMAPQPVVAAPPAPAQPSVPQQPAPLQQVSDWATGLVDPNVGGGAPAVLAAPQQQQPLGGMFDGTDPNVGGGAPAMTTDAGRIVDLVQLEPAEPTFEPAAERCKEVLWLNELPDGGCFDRWSWEKEQGRMTELDLYLASAPANCQKLADSQEDNCLYAVSVATGYIINYMENR